jgi:protein-S-isoprenylcysteine O-methyltransferase Ste14
MSLLHFLAPVSEVIPYPWTLLGVVPFVVGAIINLLADSEFKKAQTTVKPFEKSTALITTGVFQITRHPMYLGMILILIGLAVFMGTITPLIIIVIFALLLEVVFMRMEERMLEQQFGSAWITYKSKVRKWL